MRFLFAAAIFAVAYGSSVRAQSVASPDLNTVLSAAGKALSADRLPHFRGWRLQAHGNAAGLPGTFDTWIDRTGGGEATDAHLPPISFDQGYDGGVSWTRDAKGVVWVDGSVAGRAGARNQFYRDSYALWTPDRGGARVVSLGRRVTGGATYDVVRVTPPQSPVPFEYWFDATSRLPVRVVETIPPVTTTTTLGGYRSAGGVQVAFSQKSTDSQGNATTLAVDRVYIDPARIATHIRKPASTVHDFSIANGNETSVPFELVDNHVYLNVILNGKGPYHFEFDTGGANFVDPAVAREIGAGAVGGVQGSGVGAATESSRFARVDSLRVGNAELRDQVFLVAPVRAGFGLSSSAPVDGLIGWEVLARYVTTFDYGHDRVTLRMPGASGLPGKAIHFVFGGTQPQMPCTIDDIATVCAVDTGSRTSLDLFSPFIAAHPSVVPANATAPGASGYGIGGSDVERLGRLPRLELGGYELRNLIAGFSSATKGAFAGIGVGANVGGGVWKRFVVAFDYPNQTMSLVPDAAFDEPETYDRSGIFAITQGGHVIAVDVRPGTPAAAAGVKKGDVITIIDGKSGAGLSLASVRAAFREPAGTVLHVGIASPPATTPHDITLTLRDYV